MMLKASRSVRSACISTPWVRFTMNRSRRIRFSSSASCSLIMVEHVTTSRIPLQPRREASPHRQNVEKYGEIVEHAACQYVKMPDRVGVRQPVPQEKDDAQRVRQAARNEPDEPPDAHRVHYR